MYLNTFFAVLISLLLLVGSLVESKRTASSPKYLFSSESNILDDIPEGAFVVSQDQQERRGSSNEEENEGHSRFRRRSEPRLPTPPPPIVTPSQELCPHEEVLIRWTEDEGFTSTGSIVALCRKLKDGVHRPPLIFVSYDHGASWSNVTDKFVTVKGKTLSLNTYYNVPKKPNFFIFSDKNSRRIYYTDDGLLTLKYVTVNFSPGEMSINPENPLYVIASDDLNPNQIHLSKDGSKTYNTVRHFDKINAYYWGSKRYGDKETDIFVEGKAGGETKTQGYKVDCSAQGNVWPKPVPLTSGAPLNGEVVDFLVKNQYMFCTKTVLVAGSTNMELYVKYLRTGKFVKAKIQTTSPLKELFVYDVSEGFVMLVANHRKNETNLYTSLDATGSNYSLSLPRVLYHNPHTEVSSHWLRRAVVYRFVDIRKVNGLPSVYFATQLTVGPVGGRYLISVMTFDKGGVWKRIRGPRRNKYGQLCFYPACSLHVNLFYGSIYVHSQTVPLMSRKSAPGLIMTTGVLGSNLKITPDTYLSRNGGKSFAQVLSGKRRFAFGDHGGFVVATHFTTSQYLQYSYDFRIFRNIQLYNRSVDIRHIVTEPDEKGAVFLVLGIVNKVWRIFQINATRTLGTPCTDKDFMTVNVSDLGVGGCQIEQISVRNTSSVCLAGKNYTRLTLKSYEQCFCRRPDYQCDYNFQANLAGDCRQRTSTSLVPTNCPEGTFYFKSRGYSRIVGHNCQEDNITLNNYSPVKTPCPEQKLSGLRIVTTPALKGKMVPVVLGEKLAVQLSLTGYLPHVEFTWTLNGSIVQRGIGKTNSSYSRTMNKIGYKELGMKISNSKTTYYRTIYINTQRKLDRSKMKLIVIPTLPSVKQRVRFVLEFFNGSKPGDFGVLRYSWKVETYASSAKTVLLNARTSGPVLALPFYTTGSKIVKVIVHNDVSTAEKSLLIRVTKDLKVKNVRLSMRKGNMLVRWDAVNEPSYVVLRYRVMYRKTSDALFGEGNCIPLALDCVVANISYYTTYVVKVDTVTQAGYGPESDTESITTPMGKPSVPTNVKFSVAGVTKVEASWQPPKLPNGILIGYRYKFYKNVKDARPVDVNNATTTILVFDKLEQNVDYHLEIAAKNKYFVGDFSEAISVRTGFDIPTLPPTNIVVVKRTTTTVELVWTPPKVNKDSSYFFSPKGYHIYSVKNGKQSLMYSTPNAKFTFTGLSPFTSYTFAIAAYVSSDKGPDKVGPQALKTFRTLIGPPLAPTEFKMTGRSSSSASLSWTPQGHVNLVEKYEVYQRSPMEKPLATVTKTQVTVKDLAPFTKYTFVVRAVNTKYKSSFSNNVSFVTLEDKPGPPTEVVVTDNGMWPQSSSVRVTWKPPAKLNGIITKYTVTWYIIVDSNKKKEQTVKANSLSLEINHLREETKYGCDVVAYTSKGPSTASQFLFNTRRYPKGSQHIVIEFDEPNTAAKLAKQDDFDDKFIQTVVTLTKIRKERIADVNLNTKDNSVNFELISKKELDGEIDSKILAEMKTIKALLAPSFKVDNALTKENSLTSSQPRAGQQTSKETTASSNIAVIAGVACACAVIIIILIVALVALFRKYRQKTLYNKFDNSFQYNHEDDGVHPLNPDDGVEFRQTSYKHRNKDIETVPLADADELT